MRGGTALTGYAGLATLAAAAMVRLLIMESGPIALGLTILGVTLFLVYFFRASDEVQRFLTRRSTRQGGSVLGTSVFVLGILVLVNILSSHFRTRIDVTSDRLFTPSPQTVAAIHHAPEPPKVWAFYPDNSTEATRLSSLFEAAAHAAPSLEFRVVDPARDPLEAMKFDIRTFTSVVQVGDRHEIFAGVEEEDFLAALIRVSRTEPTRVGFLQGHGEAAPRDKVPSGLWMGADALKRRGFVLFHLDLVQDPNVVDSVDVAILAGPEIPFSAGETEALLRFLDRGGRLLVLLDPVSPVVLEEVLGHAGIRFVPHFLADPDQDNPQVIHRAQFSRHPMVRSFRDRGLRVALAGVGELQLDRKRPGVRQASLIRTGARTRVAEDSTGEPTSRILAAAVEWNTEGERPGRMVVIGDADFATNDFYEVFGNGDLFLAAMTWLSGEEAATGLRPRPRTNRPVELSRQQGSALMTFLAGILPLFVLLAGTVVWWKRR